MVKCPFCGFDNEDGVLFCEQCKSDLSSVPVPLAGSSAPAQGVPMAEAVPMAAVVDEHVPMAAVVEAMPTETAVPLAAFAETTPATAGPATPTPAAPAEAAALPAAPAEAAPAVPGAAPASPTTGSTGLPPGSSPKLVVLRGQKINYEFPIYPDLNFVGRADEKPVDIDLEDQEPPDRIWCSRQHAVIHWDDVQGVMTLEDLNSSNGTFVNRTRVHPGQKRVLNLNDVIQIGTVHLKVKV
jgi:hypothetical protein